MSTFNEYSLRRQKTVIGWKTWKTYYVGTGRLSYVLKLLAQRRNNFRAITKFFWNHVKENKQKHE